MGFGNPIGFWKPNAQRLKHLSFSGALYRVIRVQGELVGDFLETHIFVYFRWFIENISRSPSSILLPRIFRGTIIYDATDGISLRSLASLWLEFCMIHGRLGGTDFRQNSKSHYFHDFLRLSGQI